MKGYLRGSNDTLFREISQRILGTRRRMQRNHYYPVINEKRIVNQLSLAIEHVEALMPDVSVEVCQPKVFDILVRETSGRKEVS